MYELNTEFRAYGRWWLMWQGVQWRYTLFTRAAWKRNLFALQIMWLHATARYKFKNSGSCKYVWRWIIPIWLCVLKDIIKNTLYTDKFDNFQESKALLISEYRLSQLNIVMHICHNKRNYIQSYAELFLYLYENINYLYIYISFSI